VKRSPNREKLFAENMSSTDIDDYNQILEGQVIYSDKNVENLYSYSLLKIISTFICCFLAFCVTILLSRKKILSDEIRDEDEKRKGGSKIELPVEKDEINLKRRNTENNVITESHKSDDIVVQEAKKVEKEAETLNDEKEAIDNGVLKISPFTEDGEKTLAGCKILNEKKVLTRMESWVNVRENYASNNIKNKFIEKEVFNINYDDTVDENKQSSAVIENDANDKSIMDELLVEAVLEDKEDSKGYGNNNKVIKSEIGSLSYKSSVNTIEKIDMNRENVLIYSQENDNSEYVSQPADNRDEILVQRLLADEEDSESNCIKSRIMEVDSHSLQDNSFVNTTEKIDINKEHVLVSSLEDDLEYVSQRADIRDEILVQRLLADEEDSESHGINNRIMKVDSHSLQKNSSFNTTEKIDMNSVNAPINSQENDNAEYASQHANTRDEILVQRLLADEEDSESHGMNNRVTKVDSHSLQDNSSVNTTEKIDMNREHVLVYSPEDDLECVSQRADIRDEILMQRLLADEEDYERHGINNRVMKVDSRSLQENSSVNTTEKIDMNRENVLIYSQESDNSEYVSQHTNIRDEILVETVLSDEEDSESWCSDNPCVNFMEKINENREKDNSKYMSRHTGSGCSAIKDDDTNQILNSHNDKNEELLLSEGEENWVFLRKQ